MPLQDCFQSTASDIDAAFGLALVSELHGHVERYDQACQASLRLGRPLPALGPFLEGATPEVRSPLHENLTRVREDYLNELVPPAPPGYGELKMIGRSVSPVYRARHLATGRIVALKRLEGGEEKPERIERYKALRHLDHPNLVTVEETLRHEGRVYLVMEYVDGQDLRTRAADFSLAAPGLNPAGIAERTAKIACLMREIAEGVSALHEHLVLHRDIKPANVLLDGNDRPRLCDFGLLRRLDVSDTCTHAEALVGTILYMAPEQSVVGPDRPPLSVRADIYALGAVLYELLTGKAPFPEDHRNLQTLLNRKTSEIPPVPVQMNAAVGEDSDLAWICMKCLQLDPAQRFASAKDLVRALAAYERGERVRDDETLLHSLKRLLSPLQRPPADPAYIERWRSSLRGEAGISLLAHAGLFSLAWFEAPAIYAWAVFFVGSLLGGWAVWWWRLRSRPLSPMDQHVLQLWIGADIAASCLFVALVPFFGKVTADTLLPFFIGFSAIRGLTFFVEGRTCWGIFYVPSLTFFAAALLMPLLTDVAPLFFGVLYSGHFVWLSCQDWRKNNKG